MNTISDWLDELRPVIYGALFVAAMLLLANWRHG
jgi:hypothetical protein